MKDWISHSTIRSNRVLQVALLFCLLVFLFFKFSHYTLVKINIANSHSGNLKIYWTTISNPTFTEDRSTSIYVNNRKNNHLLIVPSTFTHLTALRIDPANRQGIKTEIQSISVFSLSGRAVTYKDRKTLSTLKANSHIGELRVLKNSLRFVSNGDDPNLLMELPVATSFPATAINLMLLAFVSIVLVYLSKLRLQASFELNFVPWCMLIVCGLILTMATLSIENGHPDEVTHIKNANYYHSHSTPAISCSPETLYTYTTYGVSRLDNREIAYYLSGQYLQLVSAIPLADYIKLRFFNVLLFICLTFMAFKNKTFRFIALPLLLTPQAWYIFSYFNSDALSLFITFVTSYQIFAKESILRQSLASKSGKANLLHLLLLGVLIAMQFWVKLNFYFFAVFLVLLLLSWLVVNKSIPSIKSFLPVACALICGILLFSSWELWRHSVNDFQLAEKSLQCRELTAGPLYKPSTELEKTHPTFRLRDKGVSFSEMLEQHNWVQRIFYTGLGAYGYTEYMNSINFYHFLSLFIIMFLLYLLVKISLHGNNFERLGIASAAIAMTGLISAAAFNSWTQDLQPQGRYLLVYLPMIGCLMAINQKKLSPGILLILTLVPFILALISFTFVGLVEIAKI